MQNKIIVFLSFLSTIGYTQSIITDSTILKEDILGVWQFDSLIIITDTNKLTTYYHATDLVIKEDNFEMGLSEAAESGTVIALNESIILKFDREFHPKDYGEEKWRDLVVIYVDESHIKLKMENVSTFSFTQKISGFADIIFLYNRKQ